MQIQSSVIFTAKLRYLQYVVFRLIGWREFDPRNSFSPRCLFLSQKHYERIAKKRNSNYIWLKRSERSWSLLPVEYVVSADDHCEHRGRNNNFSLSMFFQASDNSLVPGFTYQLIGRCLKDGVGKICLMRRKRNTVLSLRMILLWIMQHVKSSRIFFWFRINKPKN